MLSLSLPLSVGGVETPPGCSTWKVGHHGGYGLERGRVHIVDVDTGSFIVAVSAVAFADMVRGAFDMIMLLTDLQLSWPVGNHGQKPKKLVCLAPV
mmetsp:Transcript_13039/g.26659  ORF Transcript_13039/g.26659 Transcript_13039/m.26659 type:complete len:96 (-) Transcript_13039:83-370(-)